MSDNVITAAGQRIVKLLVGNPPQTVAQLTDATGVTRTAVTEQLGVLQAAGYVEREKMLAKGRGRPCHAYRATVDALKLLFVGNQHLLVPAIWQAVSDLGGEELVEKVVDKVSRSLAEHYNGRITAKRPRARLRQLIGLLKEEGRLVDVVTEKGGKLILHKRSCPFISMADPHFYVCQIDRKMLADVIGRPVRQVACRHEGAPCCQFEISLH
ncbi:MAG: MarR family transcriptional regulator [Pirellulales bacterium]|nr:MarR family transcriptional regulator [Pirellulales bacterium]